MVELFWIIAPKKDDLYCTRLTVGGNLIKYPGGGHLTSRKSENEKILFRSTISTPEARFICCNIRNFYLGTPMEHYKYICLAFQSA